MVGELIVEAESEGGEVRLKYICHVLKQRLLPRGESGARDVLLEDMLHPISLGRWVPRDKGSLHA